MIVVDLPMINSSKADGGLRKYKGSRYNHFVKQDDGTCLIYNSVTNALSFMDGEARRRYEDFHKGTYPQRDSKLDQHLMEGGYIVPDGMDEIAHMKHLHLSSRFDTSTWTLTICPTIACNFGCDYCFEVHRPGKMKSEVQDAIIALLEERAPRLEAFNVTWYGGEPTIAWDVIQMLSRRIVDLCNRHNIAYEAGMISNGYLLDETKVRELENLRINKVQITLDGDAEYHDQRRVLLSGKGTFRRIVENLKHFIGRSTYVSIRVNVDERNRDGVHALIDRLATAGLAGHENINMYFAAVSSTTAPSQSVIHHCLTRKGFSQLEIDYLQYAMARGLAHAPFPTHKFAGCIAIRPEEYVIQADGELHKCWDTVGQSQYAVGHLLDPQRNPLKSPEYTRWLAYDPFDSSLACRTCTWLPTCMGGCPYHAVHPAKPGEGIYLECSTFKYNFKTTLPMFAGALEEGEGTPVNNDLCSS
ncbi:MAG: SPASM domain-containing protein [Thermosphaera sp.]